MRITRVLLTNVKSYGDETDIHFESGVNLIRGENGAGKSTILEAIGYALFGSLPYTGKDFVRQGQKKGQVIVGFTGYDGREYEVTRGVGISKLEIRDLETNTFISGNDESTVRLRELLNVGAETDLKSLFQDVIGVPQGTMTAIFTETEAVREPKFNKLLRLESYRTAADELNKTDKYIRDLIEQNGRDQENCRGQLIILPENEQEFAELQVVVAEAISQQAANQTRLDLLEATFKHYVALKQALEIAHQQAEKCEQRLKWSRGTLEAAQSQVNESTKAQQILDMTLSSYSAYQTAEQKLQQFDAQRRERDMLSLKLQNLDKELTACGMRIELLELQMSECRAAAAQLIALDSEVIRQDSLGAALTKAVGDRQERDRLTGQIRDFEVRYQELRQAIDDLDAKLAQRQHLEATIRQLQQQRTGMNVQRDTLDTERQPVAHSLADVQAMLVQEQKRKTQYEQAQRDSRRCAEQITKQEVEVNRLRQSVEAHTSLSQQITTLESERITAQDNETNAVSDRKSFEKQRESLRERHNLLDTADGLCPICQQPLNDHSRGNAALHYEAEFERLRLALNETEQREQAAVAEVSRIDLLLKSLRKQVGKLENEQALQRALEKLEQLQRDQTEYDAAAQNLEDTPSTVEALELQERTIQEQLRQLDQARMEIQDAQERLIEQIEDQQAVLNRLPQTSERESKQRDYDGTLDALHKMKEQIAQLQDVDAQIKRFERELAALDDPRGRFLVAGRRASMLTQFEADHTIQVNKRAGWEAEQAVLTDQIKPFEGLDDAAAEAQHVKTDHLDDYQRYLANQLTANLLSERLIARDQAQSKAAEAEAEYAAAQTAERQATEAYDHDMHEATAAEQGDLSRQQAELNAEIRIKTEQLTAAQVKISRLRDVQTHLAELQQVAERLQEELSAFQFVKRSIRDAGDAMRARQVKLISHIAERFFGDILGDQSPTLSWGNDYGIRLTQGGEARSFNQLSGGEQMAAALSMRLALLIHLSQVRFIFLDEPTTNLDEIRRDSLATKLRSLQNVEQLFIISHDDTFGQDGVHQVEIVKVGGVSKVLS